MPPFSTCLQITPSIVNLNDLKTSTTVNFRRSRRCSRSSAWLPFTTADLAALSDEYVSAIDQFLSDSGAPALTAAQSSAITAQLLSAAIRVPGVKSSPALTYSTCP